MQADKQTNGETVDSSIDTEVVEKNKIPLMVLTNESTPFKGKQLLMFYQAAAQAQLAYMDGKHPDTGEIVPLLVGLEPTENATQFKVFPLARLISKSEDIINYLVPNGIGEYVDYSIPTAEEEAGTSEEVGAELAPIGEALG